MAVSFNTGLAAHASGASSVSQASFTWTVPASGATNHAAIVFVHSISATDNGSSVTWDGVAMSPVSGGFAADTLTEPGAIKAYFLDNCGSSGVVVVTRTNNTVAMSAFALVLNSLTAAEVYLPGIILLQEDGAFAEQSVNDGSPGTNSLRCAAAYYGGNSPAPVGSHTSLLASNDLGSFGLSWGLEITAGQGARLVGFTQATSDDRAGVHLAVREIPVTVTVSDVPNIDRRTPRRRTLQRM